MREERIAGSVAAALIVLPVVFVPLYLIWGYAFARAVMLYGLGCTLAGIAAGCLLGRRHAALQIAASALPAALLALAVPVAMPGSAVIRYSMMGLGALLAVWTERRTVADAGLRSGLLLAPLAALLAASIVLWFTGNAPGGGASGAWTLIIAAGAAWFAVAMVLMNRLSLRQAAHAGSHGDVPAGARRSGVAGVAVFVVVSLLLAGISEIVQGLVAFFKTAARWLIEAFVFLTNLLPFSGSGEQPQGSSQPDMLPKAEGNSSPLAQLITNIIIAVVLLAVVAALLFGLSKLFPKLWKKLQDRMKNLFATWHEDESDYQDRAESLMSLKQALAGAGARLSKFARRFRRKPRLGDFHTNAGKARFLFREYLQRLAAARREPPPGATATEIARPAPALASAYNRARYAGEEPGDAEIEKAAEQVEKSR